MGIAVKTKTIVTFDRKVISRNWKKINRNPIQRAGIITMLNARRSIRSGKTSKKSGKRLPSRPGQPPKSWSKGKGKGPPFKQIFSVPNFLTTSTTVGMVGFGKEAVPGKHEKGGNVQRRVFVKTGQRRTKKGRFGKSVRKPVVKTIRLAKRPFMRPALLKSIPRFPDLWRNSITSRSVV